VLTDDFASAPPEGIKRISEKFGPILALLDELDTQYKQGKSLHVGEYLHLFIIAVMHQHTGKKVAQNLIQACLKNGIRKGYRMAVTEATDVISQPIFRKCGFVERIEIPYKTFTYQGRRVFASIEGHTGTISYGQGPGVAKWVPSGEESKSCKAPQACWGEELWTGVATASGPE
jgi:hypothetical protein